MALLDGYCDGRPFAVISDAFPHGYLPLPALPSFLWTASADDDRKKVKARRWLPCGNLEENMAHWREKALADDEAYGAAPRSGSGAAPEVSPGTYAPRLHMQPRNSINRLTGTTGKDGFAPRSEPQLWFFPGTRLDIYAVLDEDRLDAADLRRALNIVGETGYGRDAGVGLGKFALEDDWKTPAWKSVAAASFLALAPCAPQGLGYDAERSWYQVKTHFGRHGDMAALSRNPFKQPLLMAQSGAVFSLPGKKEALFLGQGIARVSSVDELAVHQGYAPVVPLPVLPQPSHNSEATA